MEKRKEKKGRGSGSGEVLVVFKQNVWGAIELAQNEVWLPFSSICAIDGFGDPAPVDVRRKKVIEAE